MLTSSLGLFAFLIPSKVCLVRGEAEMTAQLMPAGCDPGGSPTGGSQSLKLTAPKDPTRGRRSPRHTSVTGKLPRVGKGAPGVHVVKGGHGVNFKCIAENQKIKKCLA